MAERHTEHGTRQSGIARTPPSAQKSVRRISRRAVATAILCACMVLFAATLRVAHSHTAAEQESGHCPICVAIHSGMPAATAPVHIILHAAPEPIVTLAPKTPEKVRVETLSDRAPPALA
ncbi:MAG: hypothetical protein WA634_06075 [Silvibacterium sp.]